MTSMFTTAVVAYGTYRLANWAWQAWNPKPEEEDAHGYTETAATDRARSGNPRVQQQKWKLRRQRLERCREETVSALQNFLPTLKGALEEPTDVSSETQALKQLRAQKRNGEVVERSTEKDLWDVLKVQAFTRMISTAYAHTILFLVLTVQVNLLGGRLLDEQMRTQASTQSLGDDSVASDRMSSYQSSHKLVLTQTYEHFFQRGVASLVQTVERAVADVLGDWDVTDPSSMHTTREMVEEALQKVRDTVEGRTQNRRRHTRPRSILRFLLPPPEQSSWNPAAVPDELAQSILDETWDLLESPVLEDAQRDCLSTTFDFMRDQHWGTIFVNPNLPGHAASVFVATPLAHVITQLKHSSNSFYKPPDAPPYAPKPAVNSYVSAMERLPTVLELGDVSFN